MEGEVRCRGEKWAFGVYMGVREERGGGWEILREGGEKERRKERLADKRDIKYLTL